MNCTDSMRPEDFANLSRCGLVVARFINRFVFEPPQAKTLVQICARGA